MWPDISSAGFAFTMAFQQIVGHYAHGKVHMRLITCGSISKALAERMSKVDCILLVHAGGSLPDPPVVSTVSLAHNSGECWRLQSPGGLRRECVAAVCGPPHCDQQDRAETAGRPGLHHRSH